MKSRVKYIIKLASMLVLDIIIPLAIIILVPKAFGCTFAYALSAIPEQACPILIIAITLLFIGFVKVIKLFSIYKSYKLNAAQ